ncbi:microfibrillar-associated protein 2-like isoform X2 [Salvelinus fontinalis]|uniref:microfibrillar-associated protein 2-like isoform X2 n=1 Tax=Salvelinus fontinalis TaxID=8038 RepID=UPI002485466C|nr:microfibrillar-associated protein 2-like isoform X2 [Salvelinus fontinalis]
MRVLLLLSMPVLLLAQPPLYQEPFPFLAYPVTDVQQQVPQTLPGPERPGPHTFHYLLSTEQETEPTEPGPLDCREEQYPCTRLYSVHKPCKQCLNSLCFYSLRRVYVINKEVCVRTVCAHEELLRADMCRDQFSRCGVAAVSGQCGSLGSSCGKSCGGC